MDTVLRSRSNSVTIGADQPFCVIGERINPTGRKKFAEELRAGDLSTVTVDALAQVQAGANMLDVNAGIPLVDEPELLKAMLRTVQDAVDVPICIDSSVIEALEAGLSVYEGRALVNSVTAEDERLEEILPLVAKHGAAVIGLANDETGIPETPEKRLECARKIVSVANDHGIATEDVIIDPLAMTVGADTEAVTTTLATISLIRDELGVNMCLGASNVSFGLPQRHVLNAGFLPMAMAAGLTSAIMSTAEVCVQSVRAADLLLGHDPWGASWIAAHRARARRPRRKRPPRERRRSAAPRARAGGRPPDDGAARVRLRFLPDGNEVRVPSGTPIFDAASWNGIAIDSTCGGYGTCKKCKVRVVSRRRAGRRDRPPRVHRRRAARRMAAGLPGGRARGPRGRGPAAADPAQGGAGRRRAPRDPAPGGAEAPSRARRADARGPALGPPARARRARRPRAPRLARGCCARSAASCARRSSMSPPSSVDAELIALEPGDTTARRFAIAFDLGTTTVVATLLDLETGQPAAVRSMLNRQQPYGADVITRISATMMDDHALGALRERAHETLAELTAEVLAEAAVAAGRSTRSPSAAT